MTTPATNVPPSSAYLHFIEPDPPSARGRPRRTGSSSALQMILILSSSSSVHRLLSPVRDNRFLLPQPVQRPHRPHLCTTRLHGPFLASSRFFARATHPTPPRPLRRLVTTHTLSTTYPCCILHAARPPLAVPTPIADAVLAHPLDSIPSRIGYNSHLHLHAQTRATAAITTQSARHTPARFGVTLISALLGCRIFPMSLPTFLSPSSPSIVLDAHSPNARLLHGNPPMAMRPTPRRRAELVRLASDAKKQRKDDEHNADVAFHPAPDCATASGIRYRTFFGSVPFFSLEKFANLPGEPNAEEDFKVLPRTMSLKRLPRTFTLFLR
ncbi:hypothetical protein B0H14DRAFT_3867102 [Mycena olivaceomarginata]|nr:hypothetical protein B0H14DRAFT_3867102 [Mycena olivaceomarginata]